MTNCLPQPLVLHHLAQDASGGGFLGVDGFDFFGQVVGETGDPVALVLIRVEERLVGDAGKACDTLGHKVLHALRDERLLEKGGSVAVGVNQLVKLLDLVA